MDYDGDGDGMDDLHGLFTGDAEAHVLAACVQEGRVGDVDLLKVPHHGSRASVDGKLLASLRPEVSLISVGAYNRYGHPAPEALSALEACGSTVVRTDEHGSIRCCLSPAGITVHPSH
jgi:competence protein ComEC